MNSKSQAQETIAIIAGKGSLPYTLVRGILAQNKRPFLIGLGGQYEAWIMKFDHAIFEWGQLGGLFSTLKDNDITKLIMAGSMVRPKLNLMNFDLAGILAMPEIFMNMIGGDNSMLSGFINMFLKRGITVIGAHEIMPELLTSEGIISGGKVPQKARENITQGILACKKLGELDIGQASIAVGGRVVAVEGVEGTDAMIDRVTDLRIKGRLREKGRNGVLVKSMKPDQDMRVDLPAIGPRTIQQAAEAGLRGIAIEAGHSIILEPEVTLEEAASKDIFIYGFDAAKDAKLDG